MKFKKPFKNRKRAPPTEVTEEDSDQTDEEDPKNCVPVWNKKKRKWVKRCTYSII